MSQPSPLTPARQRAQALADSGDVGGAVAALEHAVSLGKVNLGEDDPGVLAAAHQLGQLYAQAGDPSAARRVLEETYASGLWRLGDSDPLMLEISYDIGTVADELGNRHEARKAFTRVVQFGGPVLGADHWLVAQAQAYGGGVSVGGLAQPVPPQAVAPQDVPQATAPAQAFHSPAPAQPVPPQAQQTTVPAQPVPPQAPQTTVPARPVPPKDLHVPVPAQPFLPQAPQTTVSAQPVPPQVEYPPTWTGQTQAAQLIPAQIEPSQIEPSPIQVPPPEPVPMPPPASAPQIEPVRSVMDEPTVYHPVIQQRRPAETIPTASTWIETPERDDEPTSASGRRGTVVFATVVAVAAVIIAAIALGFAVTRDDPPAKAPDTPVLGGGPPPTDVTLEDHGSVIEVRWVPPKDQKTSFIVSGGPAGQELQPMGKVGPTETSYAPNGLNSEIEYCFAVVAVYSTTEFASSPQVCTKRAKTN